MTKNFILWQQRPLVTIVIITGVTEEGRVDGWVSMITLPFNTQVSSCVILAAGLQNNSHF